MKRSALVAVLGFAAVLPLAIDTVTAARHPASDRIASEAERAQIVSFGGIYRAKGTDPEGENYFGIAAVIPRDDELKFTWWVDREVVAGIGEMDRHRLVVDWGEKYPVIYASPEDGVLSGEWDDGAGTDTLELFAALDPEPAPAPHGRYRLEGVNPDGSSYAGMVTIALHGDAFELVWHAGPDIHRGTGKRQGNLLQVERADGTPAIYALDTDGTLRGLLGKGRGEETLTPVP